jgi:hypothetical protein
MLACDTYTYNVPLRKASPEEGNNRFNKESVNITLKSMSNLLRVLQRYLKNKLIGTLGLVWCQA